MSQNPYGAGGGYQQYPAPGQTGYPAAPPVPGQPAYGGYPGYPTQQPGYPTQQPGYPTQQPGYPTQQPGYPTQQPGYPTQQPGYPSQQPGYPSQPSGYPPQQPGYPGQGGGYPGQGSGYPGQGSGYPGQGGGYPNPGQQPSYPVQPSGNSGQQPGYPSQGSGYPSGQPGYPNPGSGYPNQQPPATSGYPNPGSQPGYPAQGGGYPPQQPAGYPSQTPGQQAGGYPAPAAGGGYPAPAAGGGHPSQPSSEHVAPVVGHRTEASSAQKLGSSAGRKGDPYQSGNTAHLAKTHGTIRPHPDFDAADDASKLRKAMKGFGTNEQAIIDVLCNRSNGQRQQITIAYKSGYGRDLLKDLKSELGGDFEDVIMAVMMPPYNFLAEQLHSAMSGAGTDEDTLFETLCTHTNAEINGIKAAYGNMYGKSLEDSVRSESSHNFKLLLTAILQANRNESHEVDPGKAADQAMALYRAGEKKSGTDEETFTVIVATQSAAQLHAIMAEYENISKKNLLDAVKSETSGDYRQALLAILKSSLNRPAYFAERLRDAMSGAGTRDSDLIRLVVSRSEYDLANIKEEYVRRYGRTLEKDISSETSGDYKKALVVLVEGN